MKKFSIAIATLLIVLFSCVSGQAATNLSSWVADSVYIDSTGIIYAGSGISLGGVLKTSWGSVVSPWEDSGTTTTLTSAPTKFILTHSTGVSSFTGYIAGTADIVLENSQKIDGGTNNQVIFTENSDSLDIEFTGNDITLRPSDGGIIFVTDASDATGTFNFQARGDTDDELTIDTISNVPTISTTGSSNLDILSSSGEITFGDDNLTTTGTLDAGATTVTSVIIGDDTYDVVVDDEFRFASNDESSTIEAYGFEAKDAILRLTGDQGDDNGDTWEIESDITTNSIIFKNDTSGAQAAKLTMTTAGNISTTGDILVAGTTPLVTIGDAGAEDTILKFDGAAQDYYVGLDDTDDDLDIGLGSTPGTTPALSIDENQDILIHQNMTVEELNFAADGGANDTYVITLAPAPAALTTGMMVIFTATTANTDGATLNVNGLGAKSILKLRDQALATGDIEAGQVVVVVYNGTAFEMISQLAQ